MFKDDLVELFDLSVKNKLPINDKNKQFLPIQREDVRSSSMATVDLNLLKKEARKRDCEQAFDSHEIECCHHIMEVILSSVFTDPRLEM